MFAVKSFSENNRKWKVESGKWKMESEVKTGYVACSS